MTKNNKKRDNIPRINKFTIDKLKEYNIIIFHQINFFSTSLILWILFILILKCNILSLSATLEIIDKKIMPVISRPAIVYYLSLIASAPCARAAVVTDKH
jgi:hypothetical protein